MECRDSALFQGVDERSCQNMLECFGAYERRFTAGQTLLVCGEQQDMIGVLLTGSAALLRLHADGNRTVLETMDEGSVFGEELAFTGLCDGSALIECREDCRVLFLRYESRRHDPFIDLRFFRSIPFSSATVTAISAESHSTPSPVATVTSETGPPPSAGGSSWSKSLRPRM